MNLQSLQNINPISMNDLSFFPHIIESEKNLLLDILLLFICPGDQHQDAKLFPNMYSEKLPFLRSLQIK